MPAGPHFQADADWVSRNAPFTEFSSLILMGLNLQEEFEEDEFIASPQAGHGETAYKKPAGGKAGTANGESDAAASKLSSKLNFALTPAMGTADSRLLEWWGR